MKLEITKNYLNSITQPLYIQISLPPNFVESHPELFPLTASQKRKRDSVGETKTKHPKKKKKFA